MAEIPFAGYLISFMMNVVILAGIPLAIATACGLVVSLLQAITQIQDQTLSQTVKITAITLILLAFGGTLVAPLLQSTNQVFDEFGTHVR